ncbi:MAG: LysR family transcriptional regulator [Rubrivivax sp.]|nr:LysR family transcriptional regulator [Rubrivivax sp.]
MDLDDIGLFIRIVELGTLSAAARERDVPVSQVTRALVRLEGQCGVRLLHRSTHGLSLTDEGDRFLAQARRLAEIEAELQAELAGPRAEPSGWVRVSVSPIIAQMLIAPSLPSLIERHPRLHLDIAADDRIVDMVREGIDVAIRTGSPAGDSLVARPIGQLQRRLYAAPAYAQRHGLPQHPDELSQHRLISNGANPALNEWALARGRERQHLSVRGHARADNTAVVLSLVQHGVGIGRFISIAAEPLVRSGQLLPVLPDWGTGEPLPVFAVMLKERHRMPKLRACIDHWQQWLGAAMPAAPEPQAMP